MKKRAICVALCVAIVTVLVAMPVMAGGQREDGVNYVLDVGTVLTEADPLYQGLIVFQNNVRERTNGEVEIRVFPNSQLGADEDVLEQAIVGANVGIITDPGRLASYVQEFAILGAPYIVDDYEDALRLLDTTAFNELSEELTQHGLKILAYNYFQGTRHLFTTRPVRNPQDMSGQRVRSSGSNIVSSSVRNMGANPVVVPWGESYSALQQGVIDGVEVHYSAAIGASIPEVTDYLSKTAHFQLLTGLVVSNEWFESLPTEYQAIVVEEAFNGGRHASELVVEKEEEFEQQLIAGGLELVDVDVDAFRRAAEQTYDDLGFRTQKDLIDIELGR